MPARDSDKLVALGAVIREVRVRRDLSQEALAERTHLSRTGISNIERGAFAPSFLAIAGIAAALDLPLTELVRVYEERLEEQS